MAPRTRPARTLRLAATGAASLATLALYQAHRPAAGAEEAELAAAASTDLDLDGMAAHDPTGAHHRSALIVDFVDPQDGEGSSEEEIAAFVDSMEQFVDSNALDAEPAGFYSEGEHLWRIEGDPQLLAHIEHDLEEHPLVEGVEPELIYSLPTDTLVAGPVGGGFEGQKGKPKGFIPNDPMFDLQWHMTQIRAPEAWTTSTGKDVIVAVIDTGVAYKNGHGVKAVPDLAGIEMVHGETFVDGATPEGLDDHAHGTHVAGTIAQATNNELGVAGVAYNAKIMPLKVLDASGRGSVPAIANAIRYAADHGAQVINMSLGGPLPSPVLKKAIAYAHSKGVTTVAAAGNERRSKVGYPAANPHTVAVSAVDYNRQLTFYSNFGKAIDIAAPGGDTRADKNGDGHPDGVLQNTILIGQPDLNDYLWFQGTSMASPHAAGVAALIVGEGVTNPDEVEKVMKESAVHPDGVEWDKRYGAGIVDAKAAVDTAKAKFQGERTGLMGLLSLVALGGLGVLRRTAARGAATGVAAALVAGLGGSALGMWGVGALAALLGAWGSPLLFSALLPTAAVLTLLSIKRLRPLLVGLSLGVAALLLHGAAVLPNMLTDLPGGAGWDRAWLFANAVGALWLARRVAKVHVESRDAQT